METKIELNETGIVEDFLKQHRDMPMGISELKKKLPQQVTHQTLLSILNHLQLNGKIIIGTKGVQWIFTERKDLNNLIKEGLEI